MLEQHNLTFDTRGRGTREITDDINRVVAGSSFRDGLCHLFIHHTSASLIITENADPSVRDDLDNWIARLVRDGDPLYRHDQEGPDDMAAHIRSVLTQTEISIPFHQGRLALGTWQGVFIWEHRHRPHRRKISISLLGANG